MENGADLTKQKSRWPGDPKATALERAKQKGHTEIYRGAEYAINFVPKMKIELVIDDGQVEEAITTIRNTANTEHIGDGKIFVLEVAQAVRIRTGETGAEAL